MAQWYRAFVTIPHDNGLPKDEVTNGWAFYTPGSGDRDLIASDIDTRLTGFYSALGAYRSSSYTWTAVTVDVIDMLEDQPRVPFYSAPLTMTEPASTANDMPPEVAVVLSFQAAKTSGVNMRRRRGRVYLGPLQLSSGDVQVIESGLISAITNAASTFLLNPEAPAGLSDWAVYSPYTHHGVPVGERYTNDDEFPEIPDALPSSFHSVVTAWVDNAWDTQRRRGTSATTRTTITAS